MVFAHDTFTPGMKHCMSMRPVDVMSCDTSCQPVDRMTDEDELVLVCPDGRLEVSDVGRRHQELEPIDEAVVQGSPTNYCTD